MNSAAPSAPTRFSPGMHALTVERGCGFGRAGSRSAYRPRCVTDETRADLRLAWRLTKTEPGALPDELENAFQAHDVAIRQFADTTAMFARISSWRAPRPNGTRRRNPQARKRHISQGWRACTSVT